MSLVAGAAGLAALLVVVRDGEQAIGHLRAADPAWLALAAVLTVAAWWLRAWRSQILAAAFGQAIPAPRMLRYYLASAFVSHVTPTSTGGLPVFIYFLTREHLPAGHATAVAVVDSGLVVLWLLAAWPAAAALKGLGGRPGVPGLTLAVASALVATALLAALVLARPRAIPAVFMRLLSRVRARRSMAGSRARRLAAGLVRESLRFTAGVRYLVLRRPWHLLGATLLTGLYWAVYLSIAWAVLVGMGARVDWEYAAAAQLLFNLFQPFIPTPGGSGGAELMMAYLFRRALPAPRLAVFVAVWRMFIFYASLTVGGLMFFRSLGAGAPTPYPAREGDRQGARSRPGRAAVGGHEKALAEPPS